MRAVGGRAFAWCNSSSSSVQRVGNRENPQAQAHGAMEENFTGQRSETIPFLILLFVLGRDSGRKQNSLQIDLLSLKEM